jgi:hypothetical protein
MYYFCKNALFGSLTVIVFIGFILSAFIASSLLFIGFLLRFTWDYSNLAIQKKLNYIFEI